MNQKHIIRAVYGDPFLCCFVKLWCIGPFNLHCKFKRAFLTLVKEILACDYPTHVLFTCALSAGGERARFSSLSFYSLSLYLSFPCCCSRNLVPNFPEHKTKTNYVQQFTANYLHKFGREMYTSCRSRFPSAATYLLRSWVRIPLKVWMFVSCVCLVLCRQWPLWRADHDSEQGHRLLWGHLQLSLITRTKRRVMAAVTSFPIHHSFSFTDCL